MLSRYQFRISCQKEAQCRVYSLGQATRHVGNVIILTSKVPDVRPPFRLVDAGARDRRSAHVGFYLFEATPLGLRYQEPDEEPGHDA
jgi:hypothetical protein